MHPGLNCPECGAPAASIGPQTCGCGLPFVTFPGYASDPSVVPSHPQSNQLQLRVKAPGVLLLQYGVLEPMGVAGGNLDPLVGAIPLDQSGVMFPDILSVSLWRKKDWVELVTAILLPIPLGLLMMVPGFALLAKGAGGGAAFILIGLLFLALGAFMVRRALVIQKHFARIASPYRTITIRFDRPGGVRDRFREELLRRAGMPQVPMP